MLRRDYLRATGILPFALVGGCAGNDREERVVEATDTGSATEITDRPTTMAPPDTATTTETETATPTPKGEPAITILEHQLVVDEGQYTTDVFVAASVTNEGDVPSGTVELTADWYDVSGNYLDNDKGFLRSLDGGETWAARVYYLGTDPGKVANYEFEGRFQTESPDMDPVGLELLGSEMNVGQNGVVVEGTVENQRDEVASYVEATSKFYDAEGVVIGDEYTNVTDVPPGERWAFEMTWLERERIQQANDHSVWVTDSAL